MQNQTINHLPEIWDYTQKQLIRAVNDRKHPFRLPVIGTIGSQEANLRIVVLRKVLVNPFTLICYTDVRSMKIQELQQNDRLSWHFWNNRQQIQIKASGKVQIEQNTEHTESIWKNMHIGAKASYLTLSAPGSVSDQPKSDLPSDFSEENINQFTSENFCIIHCSVDKVEWLQLNRMEHRRAKFELDKNGEWKSHWMIP